MTKTEELRIFFELSFLHWEKHRMYPPNHERAIMVTINDTHIRALLRAQHFVRSGISKSMTPSLIKSISHDIKLIEEVKDYCRQQIIEPGLPMAAEPIEVGDIGDDHGSQNLTSKS